MFCKNSCILRIYCELVSDISFIYILNVISISSRSKSVEHSSNSENLFKEIEMSNPFWKTNFCWDLPDMVSRKYGHKPSFKTLLMVYYSVRLTWDTQCGKYSFLSAGSLYLDVGLTFSWWIVFLAYYLAF